MTALRDGPLRGREMAVRVHARHGAHVRAGPQARVSVPEHVEGAQGGMEHRLGVEKLLGSYDTNLSAVRIVGWYYPVDHLNRLQYLIPLLVNR